MSDSAVDANRNGFVAGHSVGVMETLPASALARGATVGGQTHCANDRLRLQQQHYQERFRHG